MVGEEDWDTSLTDPTTTVADRGEFAGGPAQHQAAQ
jgi:hypothetical protein